MIKVLKKNINYKFTSSLLYYVVITSVNKSSNAIITFFLQLLTWLVVIGIYIRSLVNSGPLESDLFFNYNQSP